MSETPTTQPVPSGWYQAPEGPFERYWDGNQWTDQTRPLGQAQGSTTPAQKPKKKRRVFLWIFLAVQVLFIVWLVSAGASSSGDATDCGTLTQEQCNSAEDVGTGIGVILIVIIWMVVDFLLAVPYVIYRLAKRD